MAEAIADKNFLGNLEQAATNVEEAEYLDYLARFNKSIPTGF